MIPSLYVVTADLPEHGIRRGDHIALNVGAAPGPVLQRIVSAEAMLALCAAELLEDVTPTRFCEEQRCAAVVGALPPPRTPAPAPPGPGERPPLRLIPAL